MSSDQTATFLCFTPYHLLLAEAIVAQTSPPTVGLVLADEADLLGTYPGLLDGGPFADPLLLEPLRDAGGARKATVYRRNAGTLRAAALRGGFGALHVFNPQRPESRVLATLVSGQPVFVEDGLEAYRETRRPSRSHQLLRSVSALLVGTRPVSAKDYIEYLAWERGYALVPDLVRFGAARPFPITAIEGKHVAGVLERWIPALGIDIGATKEALVLLDHPDTPGGDAAAVLANATERTGLEPRQVLLKPHPRDERAPAGQGVGGAEVAERSLPAECLLARIRTGGWLLGGNSTTLVTGAAIRPDLRVVYTGSPDRSPMPALLARLTGGLKDEGGPSPAPARRT